jgi:hypothetical protein
MYCFERFDEFAGRKGLGQVAVHAVVGRWRSGRDGILRFR